MRFREVHRSIVACSRGGYCSLRARDNLAQSIRGHLPIRPGAVICDATKTNPAGAGSVCVLL